MNLLTSHRKTKTKTKHTHAHKKKKKVETALNIQCMIVRHTAYKHRLVQHVFRPSQLCFTKVISNGVHMKPGGSDRDYI